MFVKEYIYSTQWVKYDLSHTNELPLDWFVCALSDFFLVCRFVAGCYKSCQKHSIMAHAHVVWKEGPPFVWSFIWTRDNAGNISTRHKQRKKCLTFNHSADYKGISIKSDLGCGNCVPEGRHKSVHGCFLSLELVRVCSSKYPGEPETCSRFCVICCDTRAALINSD